MGELTDKIKGNVNEAVGKVKEQSADPATRDDGARQETRGKGEQLKGNLKGMLGDDI
ncbi:CsbD family protein [Sphingomonas aliaeris]|uniref:CsbD family protein n=1 Tax=Sphingomonas aliaeris TaxID=2759526 RepID=A0A974NX50_9SPHN|nr:CsbD family protein [Sphingomonas aliaeris]QQV78501.1 CsbD family protein [Sphingomonas aliaeris]